MKTSEIYNICKILMNDSIEKDRYWDADHDIIYIPWETQEGEIAKKLEAVGCHWDKKANSWALF